MMNDTKWSIDQSHSNITFKVRHLMISHVTGTFKTYDASIYTTDKDFTTAVIDVWIDAASVETGDETRDEHLKGADFFDALSHKQISFTSSTIGKSNNKGTHELWGELTMKGITKNVKLDVQFNGLANDPFGNEKAGFTVTGVINRSDWGLVWNTAIETGGFVVGDEINILCEIELTRVEHKEAKIAAEPPMNEIVIL
jgi:polyisoprenoid-binding protein YceI